MPAAATASAPAAGSAQRGAPGVATADQAPRRADEASERRDVLVEAADLGDRAAAG